MNKLSVEAVLNKLLFKYSVQEKQMALLMLLWSAVILKGMSQ